MRSSRSILCSFAALALVGALLLGCSRTTEKDATTTALIEIVKKDDRYIGWVKLECLQFITERQDERQTEIAMREKHGDGCPGDPATSPVIDRFRVEKSSGAILRYDVVDDEYQPVGKLNQK